MPAARFFVGASKFAVRPDSCSYRGMDKQEVAPPRESWEAHLKELDDRQLTELARDYRWLDEEAQRPESRAEFRRRRDAIIAECERRGRGDLARDCRRFE